MYKILSTILGLAVVPAWAADGETPCAIRQQNLASFRVAQEVVALVQNTRTTFVPGKWTTDRIGRSVGSDTVTVEVLAGNKVVAQRSFEVIAKADRDTKAGDCTITQINLVEGEIEPELTTE